ncbi:hypothetical protein NW768_004574 [Fusarium equiseti]|uniref:Uncharacterized protein n=1 Tax=Fusarium equiseti TaxID=61235 RepID=A0ABQ8RGL5_FUSEQ|nr:hypothetical protein NW768_004574 [Fusarium equiseti]
MMGKFGFSGRKKQAPTVTVTAPPMNKAQKILGASAINIDNNFSSSSLNLAAPAPGIPQASSYGRVPPAKQERGMREWGDESDIVPRQFRVNGAPTDEYDEDASDMTSIMRKRQSSSTLHSWYDKTKQPLSITQQTSASAMAKGMPSKAERMLDMENSIAEAKLKKKKPTKLDLSHLMGRRSKKNEAQWDGPMLDQITRSPSILSPTSTPSLRGKLSRRPTKESLRSATSETNPPKTDESNSNRRQQNHLNGLPNLYEHYEQMSFRSIIDDELDEPDEDEKALEKSKSRDSHQPKSMDSHQPKPTSRQSKLEQHIPPGHHAEHIVSQYAKRNLPQPPQPIMASKPRSSSVTDCAASVSSRHTRTSKASKRTSRSFQESDLQEKSVLSLSSDSEDDDAYTGSSTKSHPSIPEYATSDAGSSIDFRPGTSRTSESADNSSKRLSRSSKQTTGSGSGNYLTIPNGHQRNPVITPRSSSLSGSSTNTIQEGTAGQTPSRTSSLSNSSANTSNTGYSKGNLNSSQSKIVALYPEPAPEDYSDYEEEKETEDSENEPEPELDFLPAMTYIPHGSISTTTTDAPTPPLSPSSVDFYIRSAHSSIDGKDGHNRFMAVTRQEEMLLSALRHKRQTMRSSVLSEMDEKVASKGHKSKPSEATITEETMDFDFPAPPTFKDKTTVNAEGNTVIDLSHETFNDTSDELSPTQLPTKKSHHGQRSHSNNSERILLYIDKGLAAEHSIDDSEPSPDLDDFYDYAFDDEESEEETVPEVVMYTQQRRYSERKDRHSALKSRSTSRSQHRSPSAHRDTLEVGVPRPDSPISPDAMTTSAPRVNKTMARLSAVGPPAKWGFED